MRAILWFLALFAVAVTIALFAGNNQGTVTLFWPPYRIDLSFNLMLLMLMGLFLVLYAAMRALSALLALPGQARRWRLQHQERALQEGLLEAMVHLAAGRFVRARKAADSVLRHERQLARSEQRLPYGVRLQALTHMLAAQSAHALQDRKARDEHVQLALELVQPDRHDDAEVRDGLQLQAAQWAFDDQDVESALQRLDALAQGTARRTLALRLRFKVARLARHTLEALEMARLLGKHAAYSQVAMRSILSGLATELLQSAYDGAQLQHIWDQLEDPERRLPDVALTAAQRMLDLGSGDVVTAQRWLLPVWEEMGRTPAALSAQQRVKLVLALERSFSQTEGALDAAWLTRIETAQINSPRDAMLQYLVGMACMRLSLWGKAQLLLRQSLTQLQDQRLRRNAWRSLAQLAQQREDTAGAAEAWRKAAME
jgi:HemY protein